MNDYIVEISDKARINPQYILVFVFKNKNCETRSWNDYMDIELPLKIEDGNIWGLAKA